ncbi:MAG: DUF349 domain-containing protein [Vicinamibacterales bacterium]
MGILEKLRPLPKWKHSDPTVRAAAVFELGATEGDVVLSLARDDGDSRVRRAAVGRLDSVSALAEIARTDPDDDVRADAVRAVTGLAAEATTAGAALDAVRALVELNRTKELVAIARDNASAEVRMAVVDAVTDARALGSISRHAADGATRLTALARLVDVEELQNVALKAEHTDVAVAALERVTDPEAVASIGQRARNKVAARRARTRLRLAQESAQPPRVAEAPRMSAGDRARADSLIAQVEAVVTLRDPLEATTALSAQRLAWAEFNADVEIDEPLVQQFEAASDAAREAIAERERERAAEDERAGTLRREQADRMAICEAIEQLDGPQADDHIAELKVRWDSLPAMPSEYAASLNRRFQDACRTFEDRGRRRRLAESASARLDSLATEVEQILAAGLPLEETLSRWRGVRRDADVLREFGDTNPAAAERLERAVTVLEEKEQEQQQVRTKQEADNLRRLQQLCRQLEGLMTAETLSLKSGDKALRDIKAALETRSAVPSKQDRQEIHRRLEAARTALGPRVQELRDADEWQRWANLQVQEELCKEMEALKAEEKLDIAARRMRELQGRWKVVALAPRAQGEALWKRFKTAQDEVFNRTSTHFAAQQEERITNLARKQALCEKAESLADSTEWVKTATVIQQLQAEWKSIGAVSRGHEKAIWERFRGACDRFFTRRQEDLKHRKEDWAANLTRKEALCERAESLALSTEWEATASALRTLQGEWKTIGPVRRAKSEVVWQRFRAACDQFFERYKHRDQVDLLAKAAPRESVLQRLQALLPAGDAPAGEAPEGLYATVQLARNDWQQAPELPRHLQQDLTGRFHHTLGRLVSHWPGAFAGTDLDPETTRQRMEKLVSRVEQLLSSQAAAPQAALSPTELLAKQWRERLASNTMSGGTKSAEADEARWRAADQEIRAAQSQWVRLGPVPPEVAGPLNERFQRACRRFYDQKRRAS